MKPKPLLSRRKDAIVDLVAKAMSWSHRGLLKASGGRVGSRFKGMATVQLHTIGRKSGNRRTVVLTAPIHDARRVIVVASKAGDDRHPQWFKNLQAQPDVEITMDGATMPYRARPASPAERLELWPQVVRAYEGYAEYQAKTDREIPVVICERR
ncbi:MAG: hypothetical protein QOI95_2072 [Acidimicrobiaceae bacterium]|jgi:deazaflavin-dependent oxidoreductase (nitroreductase family)